MKKPTWAEIEALAEKHDDLIYSIKELQRFTRDCMFPADLVALFWPSATQRQQAMMQGLKRYHGAPCRNCGNTLRYVVSKNCVECQHQRFVRRYHAAPEAMRERSLQWGKDNREYRNTYQRARNDQNREKVNAYHRDRYHKNREASA